MTMTNEQYAALRIDMNANPALATAIQQGDDVAIASYYNQSATPSYVVWKTAVTQDEIMQNGFDWVRVDNLSVGKARIWEWLFNNEMKSINPSKSNVRLGIDEAWKGTAADLAVREAVYVHCKRNASIVEKLFATGSGTTLSPSIMAFEGPLTYSDASIARVWGD